MTDALRTDTAKGSVATGDPRREPEKLASWKLWTTVFVIVGLITPYFYFGYEIAPEATRSATYALTVAVLLTGGALGWVVGIFISPIRNEEEQFKTYGKAVAAGISGYVLAKIDPLLSSLLMEKTAFDIQNSFRFLGFVVCFIVAMLGAFGWRRYT